MSIQLWAAWAILLIVCSVSTYAQLFVKQLRQLARWFGVAVLMTYVTNEFFVIIYCGNHLANFVALSLTWFVLFYALSFPR